MRCSVRAPVGALRSFMLRAIALCGTGLLVSSCANSYASYDAPSNVGAQMHKQVAISAPLKVDLEDDGLAVQAPPRIRKHVEPDDPSEPFSPNYGPSPDKSEPASKRSVPRGAAHGRQLEYRSRTTEMTPTEVQSVIVQAMIAHELRNP